MPHQRELMLDALVAQLINKTAAGDRVVEAMIPPWRPNQLPAIAVYDPSERIAEGGEKTAPRELKRLLELVVEAGVRANDPFVVGLGGNINKALNRIAHQIERAVSADDTLAGTVSDIWISDTLKEMLAEGDQMIGAVKLTFSVEYFSYLPEAEDVPLEDFSTADMRHSPRNAVHPDNQGHDVLEDLEV